APDQMSNGSFAAMVLIWAYEYTRDTDYLRNKLYPFLKELDDFWEAYMVKSTKPYYVDKSSAHEGNDDRNPNIDLGFVRKICATLLEASKTLGVDEDKRATWQDVLDNLADYPTTSYNGKTVYAENEMSNGGPAAFHPGDQPINMEGAVFPGEQV